MCRHFIGTERTMHTKVETGLPCTQRTRRSVVRAGLAHMAAIAAVVALPAQGEDRFVVAVPSDVLEDYVKFLNGREALTVTDFGGPHTRRDVVEVVLLLQALHRGGWGQRLELEALPNVARIMREIEWAHAACSGTSFWREDIPATSTSFYFSDATVELGQFEAGLYTVANNRQAMAAKSLADVRRLRALSNRGWIVDWRTLEQLGIVYLQHVGQWPSMPKMVAGGRADFLLAPFQATVDLSLRVDTIRLVPIPGLKIGLHGTRHFLVSRRHARSAALLDCLNTGLSALRQKGVIRQAYEQSGFFNTRVTHWATLRAPER